MESRWYQEKSEIVTITHAQNGNGQKQANVTEINWESPTQTTGDEGRAKGVGQCTTCSPE
jgi:hypothetical protein